LPDFVQTDLEQRLLRDFTSHETSAAQRERMAAIRDLAWRLATEVATSVPAGREQSLALTKIEEAMFWANAGIARE
jgi:hypothetical protein